MQNKKVIKNILWISLVMFYIFPNSFLYLKDGFLTLKLYTINRGIYNFLLIMIMFPFFLATKKIKKRELILVFYVAIRTVFFKDIESLSLLSLIFIDRINFNKNYKLKNILIFILVITLVYSYYFYTYHGRLISTAIGEKNLSGFSIFILYLLADKGRNKFLKIIFMILGVFTFSRNFLLAILVKQIFNMKIIIKISKKIGILQNFLILSIITVIFMNLVYFIFSSYVDKNGVNNYKSGFARYTTVVDNSNLYRFEANKNVLLYYYHNPSKILLGSTISSFKKELKNNLNKYGIEREMEPHNFYYKYILKYGIFSFFLFWYIGKILNKNIGNKYSYFMGYYIYAIILGVGFYDFYLLILKYLLESNQKRKVKNGKDKI